MGAAADGFVSQIAGLEDGSYQEGQEQKIVAGPSRAPSIADVVQMFLSVVEMLSKSCQVNCRSQGQQRTCECCLLSRYHV